MLFGLVLVTSVRQSEAGCPAGGQMPLKHFPELEAELAARIPEHYAIIQELKQVAWLRQRQRTTPVRRGFLEVKERDGPGSPPRDARWRGGSRKKLFPS
jgi:hypothetical protein